MNSEVNMPMKEMVYSSCVMVLKCGANVARLVDSGVLLHNYMDIMVDSHYVIQMDIKIARYSIFQCVIC